jgi:hypothetical protein
VAARVTAGRRAAGAAGAGVVLAVILAGCGAGAPLDRPATFPPTTFGAGEATGADVAATRAELVSALGALSLQLDDPQVPHRPPESSTFAAAPRAVFQVVLPDDPAHGFVSVYEFADEARAAAAGKDQAAYIASGPGRVQFVPDTRFVIRQVGRTVVFFTWSPLNSPDPRTADIQKALETVGTGIPVPS